MSYIIVGLGNPGEEYTNTRHNVGRMAVSFFHDAHEFSEWKTDVKTKNIVSNGSVGKAGKFTLVLPDNFMNNSGKSIAPLITSLKKAESLVVVHDDLDLPFGKVKISFNKSAGGHRGVSDIVKKIKTEGFIRIRVGISKLGAKGMAKKPGGEEAVLKMILGKFKPEELKDLKKEFKRIDAALLIIGEEGWNKAASVYPNL